MTTTRTHISLTPRAIAAHIAWLDAVNALNLNLQDDDYHTLTTMARDEWKDAMTQQDEWLASGEFSPTDEYVEQMTREQCARNAYQQAIARASQQYTDEGRAAIAAFRAERAAKVSA